MYSVEYYSLSKPKLRNSNALMCISNSNNLKGKRRSQTEITMPTEIEDVIAKRMSRPSLLPQPFMDHNRNMSKPCEKVIDKTGKLSSVYERTLKFLKIHKNSTFELPKQDVCKTKLVRGINAHRKMYSKENMPAIRGIRGARAYVHPVFNDPVREMKTAWQTRNQSHDFDLSLIESNNLYLNRSNITIDPSKLLNSKTPKTNKICIRCPAPKLLL